MLQHVVEAQVLDLVFRGMDLLIGVLELGLDDKRRGVPVATGGGMVRAGISALSLNIRHITVAGNDLLDEGSQALIDKVDDNTDRLLLARIQGTLHIAGHILLEHSLDIAGFFLVFRVNGLGAEQTAFFGRVPVELDGVAGLAVGNGLRPQQGTESFEDGNCAAAVVIGARGQPG